MRGAGIIAGPNEDVLLESGHWVYVRGDKALAEYVGAEYLPREYCGVVCPSIGYFEDIDLGDGWYVDFEIHNLVTNLHGVVVWGRSEAMFVAGTQEEMSPVCWAWNVEKRLVAVVAPKTSREPVLAE